MNLLEADLKVESRGYRISPWALSVGIVPGVDPTLYSLGTSYKLTPALELITGVGLQENHSQSFVWGATLDLGHLFPKWLVGTE